MSIKHSKYKNTGILFELLVRQITTDTLDGKDSPARKILKNYFVKTELGREYKLYDTLFKKTNLTENDIARRNTIAKLLGDWGLVSIINPDQAKDIAPLRQIKVIPFKDKVNWELCPKYNIGNSPPKKE